MENNMKRVYDYLKAADTYYLATVEARKAMLDAYPNLRGMYDENDGNLQLIYGYTGNGRVLMRIHDSRGVDN